MSNKTNEAWQSLIDAKAMIHYQRVQALNRVKAREAVPALELLTAERAMESSLMDYISITLAQEHKALDRVLIWALHENWKYPDNLVIFQRRCNAELALKEFMEMASNKACSKGLILLEKLGH